MKTKKTYWLVDYLAKAAYWLLFSLLVLIALIVSASALNISGGYKLLVVQSGSMSPAIPIGSLIFTKPGNTYQIGDVISFYEPGNHKYLITHRISAIEPLENGEVFVTKGDANDASDSRRVDKEAVVGKVIWALPFIGYAVSFAKSTVGLILLIIIPATLVVYSEMMAIKKEFQMILAKKRMKQARALNKRFKFTFKKALG